MQVSQSRNSSSSNTLNYVTPRNSSVPEDLDFCEEISEFPTLSSRPNRPYKTITTHRHFLKFKFYDQLIQAKSNQSFLNRFSANQLEHSQSQSRARLVADKVSAASQQSLSQNNNNTYSRTESPIAEPQNHKNGLLNHTADDQSLIHLIQVMKKVWEAEYREQQQNQQQSMILSKPPSYPTTSKSQKKKPVENIYNPDTTDFRMLEQQDTDSRYEEPQHNSQNKTMIPLTMRQSQQPPIIINNIIKSPHHQSKYSPYREQNSRSSKAAVKSRLQSGSIDDVLKEQEELLARLQKERQIKNYDSGDKSIETSFFKSSRALLLKNKSMRSEESRQAASQKESNSRVSKIGQISPQNRQKEEKPVRTQIESKRIAAKQANNQQGYETQSQVPSIKRSSQISKEGLTTRSISQVSRKFIPETHAPLIEPVRKAVLLEIPLDNHSNTAEGSMSLAEAFMKRMGNKSRERADTSVAKSGGKSKEELARLRKQMMKSKNKLQTENMTPNNMSYAVSPVNQHHMGEFSSYRGEGYSNYKSSVNCTPLVSVKSRREPSKELLERLISGAKPKIDEKEMKSLTQKNYSKLPEVKKKMEEERKKEEFSRRMAMRKEFEKSMKSSMLEGRQDRC